MELIEDAAGVRGREVIPRVLTVASPVAGADWTIPVTPSTLWYVQSIHAKLVTSAIVGNRFPAILLSDTSNIFARIPVAASVVASTTARIQWLKNYGATVNGIQSSGLASPFPNIPLVGSMTLTSATANIDVADQWSEIVLYVLEVVEYPYDNELTHDLAQLAGQTSNAFPYIPIGA